MAENTLISWADMTHNPWLGCQHVGPPCDNCYAETLCVQRLGVGWGPGAPRRRTSAANRRKPHAWNRQAAAAGTRPFVFGGSLMDWADNQVDPEWRWDYFQTIRETPHLIYLLLTKRPQLAAKLIEEAGGLPPNVALGATVAEPDRVDRDVGALLDTPNPLFYFISDEPALGDIAPRMHLYLGEPGHADTVAWFIWGGESGSKARPADPAWARSALGVCEDTGAIFHLKQMGGRDKVKGGHLLDGVAYRERPHVAPLAA